MTHWSLWSLWTTVLMVHVVLMVLEILIHMFFCNPYSPFVWRMSGAVDVHCGKCPLWWLSYNPLLYPGRQSPGPCLPKLDGAVGKMFPFHVQNLCPKNISIFSWLADSPMRDGHSADTPVAWLAPPGSTDWLKIRKNNTKKIQSKTKIRKNTKNLENWIELNWFLFWNW